MAHGVEEAQETFEEIVEVGAVGIRRQKVAHQG